jgi:hypothetical protein
MLIVTHESNWYHNWDEAKAWFDPLQDHDKRSASDMNVGQCVDTLDQMCEFASFQNFTCETCPVAIAFRAELLYRMQAPDANIDTMADALYCYWLVHQMESQNSNMSPLMNQLVIPEFPDSLNGVPNLIDHSKHTLGK